MMKNDGANFQCSKKAEISKELPKIVKEHDFYQNTFKMFAREKRIEQIKETFLIKLTQL